MPGTKAEKRVEDLSPNAKWNRYNAAVADLLLEREKNAPETLIVEFDRYHSKLTHFGFWYLLGLCWSRSPNPQHMDLWSKHFYSTRPKRESSMMKPSELRIYNGLRSGEKHVRLFRAMTGKELWYINYTTEARLARKWAERVGAETVATFLVPREDIFAYFDRRGEQEVLVLDPSRLEVVCENPVIDMELPNGIR